MTGRYEGAGAYLPAADHRTLGDLRAAVGGCRGCDLYRDATQAVFGDGPPDAAVMLVGEQPGDQEDRRGAPFVGPAGRLLDRALGEAGIDRSLTYLTNAVKHFRFRSTAPGGKRLHRPPTLAQMTACEPWLGAEMDAVDPDVVVALGATAAHALAGPGFRLTRHRGEVLRTRDDERTMVATVHPSSVLRAPDADRAPAYAAFVADLRVVVGLLG